MSAIGTALITKLAAAGPVTTAAPGGVWRDVAPAATTPPFVVVSLQGGETEDEITTGQLETEYWLVKAVTKGPSGVAADTAAAAIYTALQGVTLTISGYTPVIVRYDRPIDYLETDGETRWHHRGGIYAVTAHRS
jgi:hypothetical protein